MTRGEGETGAVTAGHGAAAPRDLRALLPALLAVSRAADLQGRLVVVRRGDGVQASGCSSSTSRSRWVPEHVKDGQFGKWLENARDWSITRNRFWGSPMPVWRSDDPAYPRVDVYGSLRRARARTSGVPLTARATRPAPAVDRRADPPQPGRPDRELTMRRVHRRARLLVRLGVDELRPGPLPVRERRLVRATTSRATSSSSTSARPAAGSTRCTCWRRRSSSGRRSRPACRHGIVLGSDGQKMSKSLRNYPDVREVFDRDGADAMRWFLMSVADPARRQPDRHRAGASARACGRC